MSQLPASLHVLERGWLSSNNILLFEGDRAILVDTGYVSHAEQTVALVRSALDGRRLTDIVNTHSHSDHIGGNAAVQRAFGCRITVPAGMHDAVQQWDENALLLSVAGQTGDRFTADTKAHPGDTREMGGLHWEALAAPGHDMDALMFFNRDHGVLISGDALWRDGFGILFADVLGTGDGIGEARRTLDAIARLPVRQVIPGHGAPFDEVDEALAAAETIAGFSLPVVMMIKESVNRAYESGLSEGLLFERRVFHSAFALDDQKEGMAAFVEKRPPDFKHR